MLPAALTSPKTYLTAGLTASMLMLASASPALAWGKSQQNFLAGVATTLAVEYLLRPQMFQPNRQPATTQYTPAQPQTPVTYSPAPSSSGTSLYQSPAARAFNAYSSNERRRIQSALAAYGYYRGSIDGAFGPGTYGAVQSYAANAGKAGMLSSQAGAFTLYDGLLF